MSTKVSDTADAVAYAVKDLSERLDIGPYKIKVLESGEATWPDASLGIRETGKMYAQALCEGYRVVLEADGKKYEYRFGNGQVKIR
jgi:hypothetical protein